MWGSMPLPLFPIQLKLFSIVLSPTQNWCTHSQILLFNSFMRDFFFSFSWGRQIRYHFRIWAALVFRAIKEYCSPTLPMLFYCIEWSFVQQKYLPRTTDTQWSNETLLGLGRHFGQINFRTFGFFSNNLSALSWYCESLIDTFHQFNQLLFQQKTKPLYPNPKYLLGIESWILVSEN